MRIYSEHVLITSGEEDICSCGIGEDYLLDQWKILPLKMGCAV